MIAFADELRKNFEPVAPMDFYREIFPLGELDDLDAMTPGKYTGIAMEIDNSTPENKTPVVKRYSVTDDLDIIDSLMTSKNFCILAPISYVGKNRTSENARIMYALCVELDNIIIDGGLKRLINQWSTRVSWIPRPTYIVASGTGLHLYYLFEKGIPLFPNVVKGLQKYKRQLTVKVWNRHVTTDTGDKIQQESIFQPFRMVGTLSKNGDITEAFRTGERVSIEYMNKFVSKENYINVIYKSNLTLAEAKKKYPEWYESRIIKKEPKKHWTCKRDLYDWWKRRIIYEATVGHRYYCLMILAIYAVKCDIPREELERDSFEIMDLFEKKTDDDSNHFTEKDVVSALQSFEDKGVVTYPVNSIANRSGIPIQKNKRNGRKQAKHLQGARAIRDINNDNWREGNGRPQKKDIVLKWRKEHPSGKKIECYKDTGVSRPTINKWWNYENY